MHCVAVMHHAIKHIQLQVSIFWEQICLPSHLGRFLECRIVQQPPTKTASYGSVAGISFIFSNSIFTPEVGALCWEILIKISDLLWNCSGWYLHSWQMISSVWSPCAHIPNVPRRNCSLWGVTLSLLVCQHSHIYISGLDSHFTDLIFNITFLTHHVWH